jgi:hypothetical protein
MFCDTSHAALDVPDTFLAMSFVAIDCSFIADAIVEIFESILSIIRTIAVMVDSVFTVAF